MFAVIMAGGSGTRFWPASRERVPKQFLKITGARTMLEETVARLESLVGADQTYVVVGAAHEELTARVIGDLGVHVLTEPVGCNTAACIGLAAAHIKRRDETAPMIVLPADHFIGNVEAFLRSVQAAGELARSGAIVTLGVTPNRPETGYGYIELGEEQHNPGIGEQCCTVKRFVEKPDYDKAVQYVSSGKHLWNSGIFAFTAATILAEIDCWMPALSAGLKEIDKAIGTAEYARVTREVYSRLESVSVDYGIMEKTEAALYVIRADFGWSDVGSWQALYELRSAEADVDGNIALGDALAIDSKRNLVYTDGARLVALLGVEDLMIIDTTDALLIAKQDRSQEVKKISDLLKGKGRNGLC